MKLNITQKHIDLGERDEPTKCPIAQCLLELFPNAHVRVETADDIWVDNQHYEATDEYVVQFIDDFDHGREVDPQILKLRQVCISAGEW